MGNSMELLPARVHRVLALPGSDQHAAAVVVETPEKSFFIVVGIPEAQAILRHLQDEDAKRPMTHDLFVQALTGFDIQITRVVISSLIETTFCATVVMQRASANEEGMREELMLDARASDSIILGLKSAVPLQVSRQVVDAVDDVSTQLAGLEGMIEDFTKAMEGEEDDEEDWLPPIEDFDPGAE